MLKVKRNTFPVLTYKVDGREVQVAHAEPGDIVEWKAYHNRCELVRISDGKVVKSVTLTKDSILPPRTGIVFQNKSKGYVLELEEV